MGDASSPAPRMSLSPEVKKILEDLSEQNGDDPIDAESAQILYGGEASTFNELTPTQKLQYACIVTCSNRDQIVQAYNALVERHNEAVRVLHRFGNRAQRRHSQN
jgi:hypothetical protein